MRDADELKGLAFRVDALPVGEWHGDQDERDAIAAQLRQLAERADHVPDTGNMVPAPEVSPPHDRCPKCTAKLPAGMTCGGQFCGLKRCRHPGCGTPTQPSACIFAHCPGR